MMNRMSEPIELLGIYLHLAHASEKRRRPHVRDRLLLIAGANASRMQLPRIAAYCRYKILQHNPQHAIGHWPTVEDAIDESDFLHLLRNVQRRYPQEKAERMLANLDIITAREREVYYSDEEYAASLLGTTQQQLEELFGAV